MSCKSLAFVVCALIGASAAANATGLYFQGFETGTSGWNVATGGDNNGAVASVPSGTLGLSAPDGSHFGVITNDTNGYMAGYGDGGSSILNGVGSNPTSYPGSGFSQSISVYIDTSLNSGSNEAFWIDMSPDSITSDGVGCFPAACSDEHNFRLMYDGTSVGVSIDGGTSAAYTISSSGWYTFQNTYSKGSTPSSLVSTDMNIYDSSNALLSSTTVLGNSDGGTLLSSNLAGPGYIWVPVWENGFSGNTLAIDDVRADAVPEPPTVALFAAMLLVGGIFMVGKRTRRA